MNNNDQHIIYSAADFERYHNGSMAEAEMYALEKAALEDPFLADALDGYKYADTPVADIEQLRLQIPPKEEKKKAPVVAFNTLWLRVAAVFVLVAGIGYITYKSNNTPEQLSPTLAEKENNAVVGPANAPTTAAAPAKIDTSFLKGRQKKDTSRNLTNGLYENNDAKPVIVSSSPTYSEYYKVEEDKAAAPATVTLNDVKEKRQTDLVKKMYQVPAKKYNLQGKVTDENGVPVPFASINTSKDSRVGTTSDANGNFLLQAKDSLMLANISAVGYAAVNQNLSIANSQNIILKRQNNQLDEVVVTSMGVQRQRKDLGYATAKVSPAELNKSKKTTTWANIQPVDGMVKYDQYVDSSQKQRTEQMTEKETEAPKGQVTLSFRVNKNGRPIRVRVEKSLSEEQDQEAIRLLQQGPKWQYSDGKRAIKTFVF